MGATVNFLFAATFPESVDFVISFDTVKAFSDGYRYKRIGKNMDRTLTSLTHDANDNVEYTENELKERWIKGVHNSVTFDSVSILMKRGAQYNKESGKYILRRDPRLKVFSLYEWNRELLETLGSNVQCHYLLFKFNKSPFFDWSIKDSPKFLDHLRGSTKSLKIHDIDGTHHAHMNSPELIAPHIIKFLEHI